MADRIVPSDHQREWLMGPIIPRPIPNSRTVSKMIGQGWIKEVYSMGVHEGLYIQTGLGLKEAMWL